MTVGREERYKPRPWEDAGWAGVPNGPPGVSRLPTEIQETEIQESGERHAVEPLRRQPVEFGV